MTQNEVDIIKNAVLDATEAYVDARLNFASFVKTQIGTTVGEPRYDSQTGKYYHKVKCNQTSSATVRPVEYKNVLSVGNTKFPANSTVFLIAPNAQYSNQFILGQLDDTPVNIVGGTIKIGGDDPYNNPAFQVDANGNVTIKRGTINIANKFMVDATGKVECKGDGNSKVTIEDGAILANSVINGAGFFTGLGGGGAYMSSSEGGVVSSHKYMTYDSNNNSYYGYTGSLSWAINDHGYAIQVLNGLVTGMART